MPGPVLIASSASWHLNVRVPADLRDKVRGRHVALPVAGEHVTVKVGDKVIASLRTREAGEARKRFKPALAALDAFFEAVRSGPRPLTLKQVTALAGDAYRTMVGGAREDEPPDFERSDRAQEEAIEAWRIGDPDEGDDRPRLDPSSARFLADMQLPYGPQLLTWRHGGDLTTDYFSLTYREAMEDLFGKQADAVCAKQQFVLDDDTRLRLLQQIGQAVILGTARLRQVSEGDFSPDPHLVRFPSFDQATRVTVATLFARWCESNKGVVDPSTIRRYTPSLNSLAAHVRDKDVRRIEQDDIWAWAEHRRDVDGLAPSTVNRNDLVAASSVFAFASTRDGKRLRPDNPVTGVKLLVPKAERTRDRSFRTEEVSAILGLARSVELGGAYPKAAASRRWVPWICAYSGARVQEPCWLEKKHVWRDDETGIWLVRFTQTKTDLSRVVPLHDALIDEGLLDFVQAAPDGLLFVGDRPRKQVNEARSIQEQRASQIAEWIREKVELDAGVDPNHGWRHSFVSRGTGKMEDRVLRAICGHNQKRSAADGYFHATVAEMKAGLDRFPRYKV